MKQLIFSFFMLHLTIAGFCQTPQKTTVLKKQSKTIINKLLSVNEYDKLLNQKPNAKLVDVRSEQEYNEGHLKNAQNIDFNTAEFEAKITTIDKNKPVFIYCLSGGRSAKAAQKMKQLGFKEVYNMDGGIMKWNAAKKPIEITETEETLANGMTMTEFEKKTHTNQYVLVDFSATWCGPCKKMMPILESLADKKKEKLKLLKIDADANQELVRTKKISSIPYLELYKNGILVWQHTGYIDEQTLLNETKL